MQIVSIHLKKQSINIQQGFTLVEVIIVLVILGTLSGVLTRIIMQPIQISLQMTRRAELVDAAEMVISRMQRDIRSALPNSIRVGCSNQCIEMMHVAAAGRYRSRLPGDSLDFTVADSSFDIFPTLTSYTPDTSDSVVVYNLSGTTANNNVYVGDNRALLAATSTTSNLKFQVATQFPLSSPIRQYYVVDTPITYYCDLSVSDKMLTRYSGYAISTSQPTSTAIAPLSSATNIARVMNNVKSCQLSYQLGSATRSGLVTINLSISHDLPDVVEEDSIHLIYQVHVNNGA